MNNNETWKTFDCYKVSVSDKGRMMIDGKVIEPSPPDKTHNRYHFDFIHPVKKKFIKRDVAYMMWRTFKGKVGGDYRVTFKDGNIANLTLDNLQCVKVVRPKKIKMTDEEMKARVPYIIEKMVKKWGCKNMQEPLTDVKS